MGGGTSGWVGSGDGADEEEKWRQTLIHLGCDRQVDTKFASDTVNTSFIVLTRDQIGVATLFWLVSFNDTKSTDTTGGINMIAIPWFTNLCLGRRKLDLAGVPLEDQYVLFLDM